MFNTRFFIVPNKTNNLLIGIFLQKTGKSLKIKLISDVLNHGYCSVQRLIPVYFRWVSCCFLFRTLLKLRVERFYCNGESPLWIFFIEGSFSNFSQTCFISILSSTICSPHAMVISDKIPSFSLRFLLEQTIDSKKKPWEMVYIALHCDSYVIQSQFGDSS